MLLAAGLLELIPEIAGIIGSGAELATTATEAAEGIGTLVDTGISMENSAQALDTAVKVGKSFGSAAGLGASIGGFINKANKLKKDIQKHNNNIKGPKKYPKEIRRRTAAKLKEREKMLLEELKTIKPKIIQEAKDQPSYWKNFNDYQDLESLYKRKPVQYFPTQFNERTSRKVLRSTPNPAFGNLALS